MSPDRNGQTESTRPKSRVPALCNLVTTFSCVIITTKGFILSVRLITVARWKTAARWTDRFRRAEFEITIVCALLYCHII